MKKESYKIMDEIPPTFFTKLGEALKLIEEYKQLLMMVDSEGSHSPNSTFKRTKGGGDDYGRAC